MATDEGEGTELFQYETREGEFLCQVRCNLRIQPEHGRVHLVSEFLCRSPEGSERFSIAHNSTISNPIDLTIIIAALTSKYAVCVAIGFTGNTTKELYLAYADSKKNIEEGDSLRERTVKFRNAIRGRKENIKAGAVSSIIGCAGNLVSVPS